MASLLQAFLVLCQMDRSTYVSLTYYTIGSKSTPKPYVGTRISTQPPLQKYTRTQSHPVLPSRARDSSADELTHASMHHASTHIHTRRHAQAYIHSLAHGYWERARFRHTHAGTHIIANICFTILSIQLTHFHFNIP